MRVSALLALSACLLFGSQAASGAPSPPAALAATKAGALLEAGFKTGMRAGPGHSRIFSRRYAGKRHGRRHYRRVVPFIVQRQPKKEQASQRVPPRTTFRMRLAVADPLAPRSYFSTWVAECEARYDSFDPRSGTFLGEDGRRHRCE